MALGRRKQERQSELWVATGDLAVAPGHVFYERLNAVLAGAEFDRFVEELCAPFYADRGRPGIPPGVYFRMLFVGYFESIESQRGIAWRCADSLSLRTFLGIPFHEQTPDHSSMTRISDRLPDEVYAEVFTFVLDVVDAQGLLKGKTAGVDATFLEANAAMKAIVRRDTGEDWKAYLTRLMREEGELDDGEEPTDEDLRRFDKKRARQGKKKVSNQDWKSESDDDARIVRMKDGRTRLGYKAEHVVDLESEAILSARVHHGTESDSQTLVAAVVAAQVNVIKADCEAEIEEVTADKGYHANETLAECARMGLRTYVPEPESPHGRVWTDKTDDVKAAVLNNRRRTRRRKGRRLQRQRSERVERSFAHICDSGGTRRSWLRGLTKINKRYSIAAAAHNLSLVMRKLFGMGQPRSVWERSLALCAVLARLMRAWGRGLEFQAAVTMEPIGRLPRRTSTLSSPQRRWNLNFSTGC